MKRIFAIFILLSTGFCLEASVPQYRLRVLKTYRHSTDAYTQGLFFWNGDLYETTGGYGDSFLRKTRFSDGEVLRQVRLSRKYFGEGSSIVDGKLYCLTWRNSVAFVYDAESFKYEKTLSYPRQGWGLALVGGVNSSGVPDTLPSGSVLVASDGSSNLYYLDRELRTLKTVSVTYNGRPLRLLNELEWIDGKIWANVYTTDMIVIINPTTGEVEGRIDCTDVFPPEKRGEGVDVLNGIAQSPDGSIFITGKLWPSLYKVQLVK